MSSFSSKRTCENCFYAKVRCDGRMPCSRCVRLRKDFCVDAYPLVGTPPSPKKPSMTDGDGARRVLKEGILQEGKAVAVEKIAVIDESNNTLDGEKESSQTLPARVCEDCRDAKVLVDGQTICAGCVQLRENNGADQTLIEQAVPIEKNTYGGNDAADTYVPYEYAIQDLEVGSTEVETQSQDETQWRHPFHEVNISNSFFNELFPTMEVTRKTQFPGSFPDIEDFEGGIHFVGEGFFGLVFKSTLNGLPVVLKVSKTKSEKANRADYREWSVSEKLRPHPNVLQIIGLCPSFRHPIYKGVGTTALIAPLQENGDLRSFFNKRSPRDDDLQNIALGMIHGIRSLHEQGVVHRDIAVRNFLVDADGRVLLCDFGLTKFIPEGKDCFRTGDDKGSKKEKVPWRCLAPESFDGIFSRKSDIWMFGLSLVELVTNEAPWPNHPEPELLRKAFNTQAIELPRVDDVPPIIAEIVHDCLQLDPVNRPTADDIAERLVKSQFRLTDNDRDENGNTRLHREVAQDKHLSLGDYESIHKARPVMVNAVNAFGETPLMLAKSKEAQRKLLSYQRVPRSNIEPSKDSEYLHNIDLFWTLLKLAEKEDVDTVKSLGELELHAFPAELYEQRGDYRGQTPLHIAAKAGNAELVDALKSLNLINAGKTDDLGQTALHVASSCGHVEAIKALLDDQQVSMGNADAGNVVSAAGVYRVNVNAQDKAGKTALHLAAGSGSDVAVKTLLSSYGLKVNKQDKNQQSAIFDSIFGSNMQKETQLAVFQTFLKHPEVDCSVTDSNGETILHKIAHKDFPEAAELLMQQAGLQIFHTSREYNFSPLHVAVRELSVSCVSIFLSSGKVNVNTADKDGNTPLHILAKAPTPPSGTTNGGVTSSLERVRNIATMLVPRNDIDFNKVGSRGNTPLHVAAHADNLIVAHMLLARSDIELNTGNQDGFTPLHIAAAQNSVRVAELLLSRDEVDAVAQTRLLQTPLHNAASKGSIGVAKMLLSRHDVDASAVNWRDETPLHHAALSNSAVIAEMLLSRNEVDPNARDSRESTPLHEAAAVDGAETAEMLLSRPDVDVNAIDKYGATPLHKACDMNSVKTIKVLLARRDVTPNVLSKFHGMPLHVAVANNCVEVVKLLLMRIDVDVNARDWYQDTPLHKAADANSVEVLKAFFARRDVDPNLPNKNRETPLHAALGAAVNKAISRCKRIPRRGDSKANKLLLRQQKDQHAILLEAAKFLLSRIDVDKHVCSTTAETLLKITEDHGLEEFANFIRANGLTHTSS